MTIKRYTQVKCFRMDDKTIEQLRENIEVRNEALAERNKMNESGYIRELIHRDHMERIGIDREEFIRMNRILAGMGNNINQIAHRINSGEYEPGCEKLLEQYLIELTDIRKKLKDIQKLL